MNLILIQLHKKVYIRNCSIQNSIIKKIIVEEILMNNVLITGAAGFIGSHLCEKFIQEDFEVYGIDNFVSGNI